MQKQLIADKLGGACVCCDLHLQLQLQFNMAGKGYCIHPDLPSALATPALGLDKAPQRVQHMHFTCLVAL